MDNPNLKHQRFESIVQLSKCQLAHLRESPAAKERRLKRNAERMREKRANESYDECRSRLEKNAFNNRLKRCRETTDEKAIRQVRDAARQRLRRAMETQAQRTNRLQKLAERMRVVRRNETLEKKSERMSRATLRARERLQCETSEERMIRLHKSSEYARRIRSCKSKSSSISETDSSRLSDTFGQTPFNDVASHNGSGIPSNHYENMNIRNLQAFNYPQLQVTSASSINYSTFTSERNTNYSFAIAKDLNLIVGPNSVQGVNKPNVATLKGYTGEPPYDPCHETSAAVKTESKMEPRSQRKSLRRFSEGEEARIERLRVIAEKSRLRRQNETEAQRDKRLTDLKDRARKRREIVKIHETELEKKERLAKQAQYARCRRVKLKVEDRIRNSYDKIHENVQTLVNFSGSPSALNILEPIIEMNPFT